MRVVLDTNVVVSASLWGGKPAALIDAAVAGRVRLVTSPALLAELEEVVGRGKLAARLRRAATTAREIVDRYEKLADVVSPTAVEAVVSVDPDDDHVLACATLGRADFIVTGDAHLLDLSTHRGAKVLTVDGAVRLIEEQTG